MMGIAWLEGGGRFVRWVILRALLSLQDSVVRRRVGCACVCVCGGGGGGSMYPTVIRGHILGPPELINPRGSWDGCSDSPVGMLWHRTNAPVV